MKSIGFAAIAAVAFLVSACDSPTESPTLAAVAGEYRATTLALTRNGSTVNFVSLGAELTLNLKTDGTTTGHLFVPNGDEDGGDLRADLVGQWTLRADTVRFSQQADTFVRDVPFVVRGSRLEGEHATDGRLQVVLQK